MRKLFLLLSLIGSMIAAGSLSAQTTGLSGFDLRLFRPPADGSGVLNLYGSETLDRWQFHLGVVNEVSHGLLAAVNPTTAQSVRVVNDLVVTHAQGAVGLTDFLEAGLTLPVVPYEKGTNLNTLQGFRTASVGDLSLDLKARLLADDGWQPGVAVGSQTTFPTGETGKFTGDSKVTEEVRLIVDKKVGPLYFTTNAGYRTVPRTIVSNLDWDDLFTFGGGVAWALPVADRSIDLMAEVDGATVLRGGGSLASPMEWQAGLRKKFSSGMTVEVGGGKGITDGVGSGEWHLIAGLSFTSPSRGARVLFQETIPFGFDKREFLPRHAPVLDRAAEVLRKEKKSKASVRGHTDSEGTVEYNSKLSRDRAESVSRALQKRGIRAGRLSSEGVGAREPAADNRTRAGKARNRRVEITVQR